MKKSALSLCVYKNNYLLTFSPFLNIKSNKKISAYTLQAQKDFYEMNIQFSKKSFIKDYKLDNMCATLEISKRTYYKYRNAEDKDYYDYLLIKEIFDESKKTYGYRRIVQ